MNTPIKNEDQTFLLSKLDGSGSDSEHAAIEKLSHMGNQLPELLSEKYDLAKGWSERSACVYYSIGYARESNAALALGIKALEDKSKQVRYRACMLLAWSLNKEALFTLRRVEGAYTDEESLSDIRAAIDAIENQNSNYFVDRDHTGMITLNV